MVREWLISPRTAKQSNLWDLSKKSPLKPIKFQPKTGEDMNNAWTKPWQFHKPTELTETMISECLQLLEEDNTSPVWFRIKCWWGNFHFLKLYLNESSRLPGPPELEVLGPTCRHCRTPWVYHTSFLSINNHQIHQAVNTGASEFVFFTYSSPPPLSWLSCTEACQDIPTSGTCPAHFNINIRICFCRSSA